jgi:thymidylate kinase
MALAASAGKQFHAQQLAVESLGFFSLALYIERVSGKIQFVCITGGPGAGKTAITDVIKREFQQGVLVLPETATMLYSGGFPRAENAKEINQIQSAIYYVQSRVESIARIRHQKANLIVCDRGTLDGAAYFPGGRSKFLKAVKSTPKKEFDRYDMLIHLETPGAKMGYDFSNPMRTESNREALELDHRTQSVWAGHPKRILIKSRNSFIEKVCEVLDLLRNEYFQ